MMSALWCLPEYLMCCLFSFLIFFFLFGFSLQGLNVEFQFPGQGLDGGGESAKEP